MNAVPGIREFLAEYGKSWGKGGVLAKRGLIPSPDDVQAKAGEAAIKLTPMDPAGLH